VLYTKENIVNRVSAFHYEYIIFVSSSYTIDGVSGLLNYPVQNCLNSECDQPLAFSNKMAIKFVITCCVLIRN